MQYSHVCESCHAKLGNAVSVTWGEWATCVLCGRPANRLYPQSPVFLRSVVTAADALAKEAGVDRVIPFSVE